MIKILICIALTDSHCFECRYYQHKFFAIYSLLRILKKEKNVVFQRYGVPAGADTQRAFKLHEATSSRGKSLSQVHVHSNKHSHQLEQVRISLPSLSRIRNTRGVIQVWRVRLKPECACSRVLKMEASEPSERRNVEIRHFITR